MVANVTQRTPIAYEPGSRRRRARTSRSPRRPSRRTASTVTVKLRAGVHFSPPVKREVTSADLKYAIERGFFSTVNNPYAGAYFGDIAGAPSAPAQARHADRRHHDAGRAHGRLQASPARPAARWPPRSCCRSPRRCRASTRCRSIASQGLRRTGCTRSPPARTWSRDATSPGNGDRRWSATRAGARRPTSAPRTWTASTCRRATTDPNVAARQRARGLEAWSPATACSRRPCSSTRCSARPRQLAARRLRRRPLGRAEHEGRAVRQRQRAPGRRSPASTARRRCSRSAASASAPSRRTSCRRACRASTQAGGVAGTGADFLADAERQQGARRVVPEARRLRVGQATPASRS